MCLFLPQKKKKPRGPRVSQRTGIEFLAIGRQSATVVNLNVVALLRLDVTLDRLGDLDLQLGSESDGSEDEGEELHVDGLVGFGIIMIVFRPGLRV